MQAHGVLTCLYEVLLHAEGDDAIEIPTVRFTEHGAIMAATALNSIRAIDTSTY